MTDIDIDFADRDKFLELVPYIPAGMIKKNHLSKHNTGVFFQDIPTDPESGIASIPYEDAIKRGWFKIDLLNLSIYDEVKDEDHLNDLLNREPMWELLKEEDFVKQLLHLHEHYHTVVKHMMPSNILQLAMVLAMRLPSKRYLVGRAWEDVEKEIWIPTADYYYKKAHAISYAHAVIVHMNLLIDRFMKSD
jgi:hypothetical protein